MAVVDRRGCDGCGRSLPVEDLVAVSLPGDEHAVCCPECREYAESVADSRCVDESAVDERADDESAVDEHVVNEPAAVARQRGECEGCGVTSPVDEFETVGLPDGSTVAVCEDCEQHAASMAERTSVSGRRGECSGCGECFDVNEMTVVELDDGTTVACCAECAGYARAAARTTADEPDYGDVHADDVRADASAAESVDDTPADASADATSNESGEATNNGSGEATVEPDEIAAVVQTSEETALVESPSVCDQCGDWVDVELFEVVTVDERVEEFCPPCKDRARRNGVVRDVRMRRAEAYAVLDLEPGRSDAVMRDAYLSRIKTVHPDSDGGSREAFRRVQRAYERLTD